MMITSSKWRPRNSAVRFWLTLHATRSAYGRFATDPNGQHLGLIKSYKWTMSSGSVQNLVAQDPNVKYVSPDRSVQGAMNYAVPAVGADMARTLGYDGTGVGVAVIDSGANSVYDLQTSGTKNSRVVYSQNFDPSTNTTADLYGHGTHVAGIVAGDGASSSCSNCDVTFRSR